MKKIISLGLITAMVLSAAALVSCSGGSKKADCSDSKYVGTWKVASMELQEASEDFDEDWTLELKADGTGISKTKEETDDFTWEPTDNGFKTKGGVTLDFTEDGDRIVGNLFGVKLVFDRVK